MLVKHTRHWRYDSLTGPHADHSKQSRLCSSYEKTEGTDTLSLGLASVRPTAACPPPAQPPSPSLPTSYLQDGHTHGAHATAHMKACASRTLPEGLL